jgi:hypothetical protein
MPHTPKSSPPPLTLLPQQSRLINATEGFLLEVHSGCLWLTRPGDSVDRFLVAGSSVELHENQVLIQSDRSHRNADALPARYTLTPLQTPVTVALSPLPDKAASQGKILDKNLRQPLWGLRRQLFN